MTTNAAARLAKNLACAAILAGLNALACAQTIERRIAYLRSLDEDQRKPAAWRDALAEQAEFGRAVGCRTWHLRTTVVA